MKKSNKQTIAVSGGLGAMYELYGVQLVVFGGWDFAMGSASSNWNYRKRF